MLAKSFRLVRNFAGRTVHTKSVNKPYFTHKSQTNLDMYIRDYNDHPERLHPNSKRKYERLTKPLDELKYKLHPVESEKARLDYLSPLGVTQDIPWRVVRTSSENLPVYRRYTFGRTMNYTEIRLIEGDIEDFCKEIKKVTSNAEVITSIGKVRVKGIHKDSILRWLYLLGF